MYNLFICSIPIIFIIILTILIFKFIDYNDSIKQYYAMDIFQYFKIKLSKQHTYHIHSIADGNNKVYLFKDEHDKMFKVKNKIPVGILNDIDEAKWFCNFLNDNKYNIGLTDYFNKDPYTLSNGLRIYKPMYVYRDLDCVDDPFLSFDSWEEYKEFEKMANE